MRLLLLSATLTLVFAAIASAGSSPTTVSAAGVSLRLPSGWQGGGVANSPGCDPARLMIVSSRSFHVSRSGTLAPPRKHQVLVLLLEDLLPHDRPIGDLRRPAHFSIAWSRLVKLKAVCGDPNAPASMRWFRTHRRYLGFIVYPGRGVSARTKAQTLEVLDSLRVGG